MATKKKNSKGIRAASKLVLKWMPRLGLGEWDITLLEKTHADKEDERCAFETRAEINANSIYSVAKLSIYPSFTELNTPNQEEVIVHELIHCLVARMARLVIMQREGKMVTPDECDKENEGVTETLTQAMLKAWRREK